MQETARQQRWRRGRRILPTLSGLVVRTVLGEPVDGGAGSHDAEPNPTRWGESESAISTDPSFFENLLEESDSVRDNSEFKYTSAPQHMMIDE
jgi:hypothetical protein